MKNIRHWVFWPPFLLIITAVILNFTNPKLFNLYTFGTNNWLISNFGWAFSVCGLGMVILTIVISFSPFGRIKIGGPDAKPMLTNWQWFSIMLCATVAVGILFWGTAEPIYHLTNPPKSLNIEPNSPQAAIYSMSTMYLHWTITPFAFYSIPALMFAFAYYNMKKPFSLSSTLSPLTNDKGNKTWGKGIDAICLYALCAGMSASLATGILTIAGGINNLTGMHSGPFLWCIIGIIIIGSFIISSVTGLMKGMKILSDVNTKIFFLIILFMFIVGPTAFLLGFGTESIGNFINSFVEKSLFTGTVAHDNWPSSWTMFYWGNWLAWTPIMALFLGRISYGHTIRKFITVNFWLPAIFSALWITVFSGTAIKMQLTDGSLSKVLAEKGPEAVGYAIFNNLPIPYIVIPVFLIIAYLAFVTSADANTSAMSGLSSTGISPESPEPPKSIKILWGIVIGSVSIIMLTFAGIDGIKMLSQIGGFPAMILEFAIAVSLILIIANPKKYDKFKNGYDEHGIPLHTNRSKKEKITGDTKDKRKN